ncbi:MAG: hypothetical protein ACRCYE_15500 [Sarcina sp.]
MPIQAGDFQLSASFISSSSYIEAVTGRTIQITLKFSNYSTTDSLYNVGLTLSLPDGVSFVSSSLIPTTNEINASFKNIVQFVNIKDLYANEINYSITVTLKADAFYRSNSTLSVPFYSVISGILFSARADTKPRGNFDSGNTEISSSYSNSFKSTKYSIYFTGPTKFTKGAGETSNPPSSATSVFTYNLKIENNTQENSIVDLNLNLANGIRFIGNINFLGTDATTFTQPNIFYPSSSGNNYTSLTFDTLTLSANSLNEITFDAAIWNNFTTSGLENSSSQIMHNTLLTSSATISDTAYTFTSYADTIALSFWFEQILLNTSTDWYVNNDFIINFIVTAYEGITNLYFRDVLDDGLEFITSSITPNSVTLNTDGTTELIWNIGDLASNSDGTLSFSTETKTSYINTNDIYSSDILESNLTANFINADLSETSSDLITKSLSIDIPSITKEIVSYHYADMNIKPFNYATVGDFIKFKITYNNSNILAPQKNVQLFEYPPYNMILTNIPSYSTNGDFPINSTPQIIADNGFMFNFGNIETGSFEIIFDLEVTDITNESFLNNLAKITIENSDNLVQSIRDTVPINFSTPNLTLEQTITAPSCINSSSEIIYTLKIKNTSNNPTVAYNVEVQTTIPNIFTISNIQILNNTTYQTPSITNNVIDLFINKLPSTETLDLIITLETNTEPISYQNYYIASTMTRGTSQESTDSYLYQGSNLTISQTLIACSPTLTSSYSNTIPKINEIFSTQIDINIPIGLSLYNANVSIELNSVSNQYLTNIKLNGLTPSYVYNNNLLTISLPQTIYTTTEEGNFQITFDDAITQLTDSSFTTETFNKNITLNWTSSNSLEQFSKTTLNTLNVSVPKLTLEKLQRNHTKNIGFTENNIQASLLDTILYKFIITNIGENTAYTLTLTDLLDSNLLFIASHSGNGTYDYNTNTLTLNHIELQKNYYIEFLIECKVIDDTNSLIAANNANLAYKTISTSNRFYSTLQSNTVNILNPILTLTKLQRNKTLDTTFTQSSITAVRTQEIQYKLIIKNNSSYTLNNILVNDFFPNTLDFVALDSNTLELSLSSNQLSGTILNLLPNETLEILYTTKLTADSLNNYPSFTTLTYIAPDNTNSLILPSNVLYTKLSGLSKGFIIY